MSRTNIKRKLVLTTVCIYAEVMMSNMIQASFVQSPQDNVHAQQKKNIHPGNRLLCESNFTPNDDI